MAYEKSSYGKFYRGSQKELPHVQDSLYADSVVREGRIAGQHLSNKGGKFQNPAMGPSGSITKVQKRFIPEDQSLPKENEKRYKLRCAISKSLPAMKEIKKGLNTLNRMRNEEASQLDALEREIGLLKGQEKKTVNHHHLK